MKRLLLTIIIVALAMLNLCAQIVAVQIGDNGKYGFVNASGQWVVQPQFIYAYWNKKDNIGTVTFRDYDGVIDKNGKIITSRKYYHCSVVTGGAVEVALKINNKILYGVIDYNGREIVPCKFDGVDLFPLKGDGIVKVKLKRSDSYRNYYGAYNSVGKEIVPCVYDVLEIHDYDGVNYIEVWDEQQEKGAYSFDGKEILQCKYRYIERLYPSPVPALKFTDYSRNSGVALCDGKVIVPCEYDIIKSCYPGIVVNTKEGYEGLYNFKGDVLIAPKVARGLSNYRGFNTFNLGGRLENRLYAGGGKWGACDSLWNIIIPCEYDGIRKEVEGLVAVNKGGTTNADETVTGGKWGFWADGREIIPCQYDEVTDFKNGVATVKVDGAVRLIKNPLKDESQILIAENSTVNEKKKRGLTTFSRYPAPDSDVDKNIPIAKRQADNTFAFIVANENYPDAPVPYSLNDGRMFKEYCQKALGLPEKNINLYEDATFGNIITAVEKMKQIAEAYDGEASIIFYYAGHGFPDEKLSTAYLLPIDGNASDITTTGYSLAKFYQELSRMKLKSSIVFLDACFSGAKREDQMLSQARGVAIKVKEETPQGNMLVFSAAQGDETAHQMEEKHHGLFTYYLLKELQAAGGDVDMGTLTDYVTKQVKRQSVVINNKKQTPTVIPSQALTNSWRNMKLK